MRMALKFSCKPLISDMFFLPWSLKSSIRMLYTGMIICTDLYSTDKCRYSISVSNGLYDTNTNIPNFSPPYLPVPHHAPSRYFLLFLSFQ